MIKGDSKQITILVASFAVGLVAFVLTHQYLRGQRRELDARRQELESGIEMEKVLVALRPLPAGTALQVGDVGEKSVQRTGLSGAAIHREEFDRVEGMKLTYSIGQYKPILWEFVDTPYPMRYGLSPTINRKMRAVSIAVGGANAVSGLIQPNDRVDVLGTFSLPGKKEGEMETVTMTILQHVTILAVGTQLGKPTPGADRRRTEANSGYSMVTVEVTPSEAELLTFASYMKGRLTLSLRNPTDLDYLTSEQLENVNFDHLSKKIPEYNEKRQRAIVQGRRG